MTIFVHKMPVVNEQKICENHRTDNFVTNSNSIPSHPTCGKSDIFRDNVMQKVCTKQISPCLLATAQQHILLIIILT